MPSVSEINPYPETGQSPAIEFELSTGQQFFEQLAIDLSQTTAGDRVALTTMSFEPSEPLVANIMSELNAAADRNVEILFGVDAFTFLLDDGDKTIGPLLMRLPYGQSSYKRRLAALEELGSKPFARYNIINKPTGKFRNPFGGRSHIKLCVINNKVSLLSSNLIRTDWANMAVSFEDPQTADLLYTLTDELIKSGQTSEVLGKDDGRLDLDNRTELLIDAGVPDQSVILDEALRLLDEEDESVIASFQFFPAGRVAEGLVAAHDRGAEVIPIHNHPATGNIVYAVQQQLASLRQRRKLPGSFFDAGLPKGAQIIHSKALATPNTAMIGSHNLDERGVRYGTSEIMLLSRDPAFAKRVGRFLLTQAYGRSPIKID